MLTNLIAQTMPASTPRTCLTVKKLEDWATADECTPLFCLYSRYWRLVKLVRLTDDEPYSQVINFNPFFAARDVSNVAHCTPFIKPCAKPLSPCKSNFRYFLIPISITPIRSIQHHTVQESYLHFDITSNTSLLSICSQSWISLMLSEPRYFFENVKATSTLSSNGTSSVSIADSKSFSPCML